MTPDPLDAALTRYFGRVHLDDLCTLLRLYGVRYEATYTSYRDAKRALKDALTSTEVVAARDDVERVAHELERISSEIELLKAHIEARKASE